MNAVLKSPFDQYVQEILASPQYLVQTHAEQLVAAIRKQFPSIFAKEDRIGTTNPKEILRNTIDSLQTTIGQMNSAAFSEQGGLDSTALKRVVDSQDKLIKILSRLQDQLSADQRQDALESALTEALEKADNKEFQEHFLAIFHANLAQKSRKLRSLT